MNITLFDGVKDTRPQAHTATFPELCDVLADWLKVSCPRSGKLKHTALIPGECGTRGNANVRSHSMLAADFDIGPADPRYLPFHAFCDKLARDGLAYFAYTTTKNCASHNKFRIILPYAKPVPLEFCGAAWHACNARFGGAIDPSTKDPARLSFLPANWHENPFHDPRNKDADADGMVTLADPFNAVRAKPEGKPILSAAEIAALNPIFSGAMNFTPEPVGVSGTPSSPKVNVTRCSHASAPVLSDADRRTLSHGKGPDDPCWALIADLRCTPLITAPTRQKIASEQGARDYRFLLACSRAAIRRNLPITPKALVTLGRQFSREYLKREPPEPFKPPKGEEWCDLLRQAENALSFALHEPRQPEAGTQVHEVNPSL